MAVPDFQSLMLPVLLEYADGKERASSEVREVAARKLSLSTADIAERLPTSPQTRLANRVAWAHSYLKQAGVLESPRRGHYRITDRGRQLLASPPTRIDIPFLERYPDFQEFRARKGTRTASSSEEVSTGDSVASEPDTVLTPAEQVRTGAALQRRSIGVGEYLCPGEALGGFGRATGHSAVRGSSGRESCSERRRADNVHIHSRCHYLCQDAADDNCAHRREATGGSDDRVRDRRK